MVTSCEKTTLPQDVSADPASGTKKGKQHRPEAVDCYAVVCEDTVLFPEGGGQVRAGGGLL